MKTVKIYFYLNTETCVKILGKQLSKCFGGKNRYRLGLRDTRKSCDGDNIGR